MCENEQNDFSLKSFFIPLTTKKAIYIIVIVGFIVFFNALFGEFVWDDKMYILPSAREFGLNIPKLFAYNAFNSFGYYRPIPATYFSFLFTLFGETTFFYHFTQISLHIINAILSYILLKIFINKKVSLVFSLIFLIHPIQVESVSYIAQATSVLLFLFGVSALLLSKESNTSKKRLALIFILLLLCLLTKEAGIIFILLILLYRYLFNKEHLLLFSSMSLFVVVAYAFIRFFLVGVYFYKMTFVPISKLPLGERVLNIPAILLYYLKTFLFPLTLAIQQNWVITKPTLQNFYLPLTLILSFSIILVLIGVYLYKKKTDSRKYLFFCFWFIFGISFYLQILPLDMTVADRWFYTPMVGLLGIIGIIVQNIHIANKTYKKTIITVVLFILVLLSIRTIARNINWYNPIALYSHDSKINEDYNIEANLGWELLIKNRLDEALNHYKKSVSLLPYETTLLQIGYIYEMRSDYQQAKLYYLKALNALSIVEPPLKHIASTYLHLGRIELYFGNPKQAKKYINQGLAEYPRLTQLWVLLALTEYKLKNQPNALLAIGKAYERLPSDFIKDMYQKIQDNKTLDVPIQIWY